jgi:hypothetical protein
MRGGMPYRRGSSIRSRFIGGPGPTLAGLAMATAVLLPTTGPVAAQMETRYTRAERLLAWNIDPLFSGDAVTPHWMRGGNRFWYRNKVAEGAEFVLVDPVANTRAPLFDRHRLAAALSLAADTSYVGTKLPFNDFEFTDEEESLIAFRAQEKRFECDIRAYACTVGDTLPS